MSTCHVHPETHKNYSKAYGENKKIIRKLIYTYKYRSGRDNCTQEPTILMFRVGCEPLENIILSLLIFKTEKHFIKCRKLSVL